MSADAKLWTNEAGEWCALHDGPCTHPFDHAPESAYDLATVIRDVESCLRVTHLRWVFRVYPDGQAGLAGWTT